ncbi:MAG: hypothetical protein WAM91_13135, partial [Candidatus Acidiferrales bacterium]
SFSKRMWAPILAAAVCVASAQAQQQQQPPPPPPPTTNPTQPAQPTTPVQPITNPDGSQSGSNGDTASPIQTTASVVTGGLAPSVGESNEERSQIRIGVQAAESFDSNFPGAATPGMWNEISNFGGHLELHHTGRTSEMMFRYAGGGLLDAQNSGFDKMYHQFEVAEAVQFRRWSLRLDDLFSYLPDSSFGFQMLGITQSNLGNVSFLNPSVPPSQTILTTQDMRVSNVILAQIQVEASQRTAFTFTGGYGLLHFTTPGFLDPTNYNFGFGYNYALNARDVLGVSYQYNNYSFSSTNSTINDSQVLVSYGHHITGRLAFQVGAGPELNYETPPGSSIVIGRTLFGANAGLNYQFKESAISASFSRGVTGGSGIIAGASGDTAQISANHQLGRRTTIYGNFGYSFNQSLPQQSVATTTYQGLYGGAGVDYKVAQRADFYVNYSYLHQNANGPVCAGPACAVSFNRHQIWVGINFDFRPIPLY